MRIAAAVVLALITIVFGASSASAAITMISTASGNINATGTWSVVDTTGTNALLNSETANTALTTSPVASSTFTPAAETLTAIGVKLASVAAAPSGTMTIKLANSTSAGNRECTQTVNVADLVSAAAATAEGGWVILTCAASPNGTDNYTINANTSASSQVNLFSLATTNWSRLLVTTGTQASGPAAGDSFLVYGQLTGAGTHNAFTVTVNTTANINYGNVANTLVSPSIAIGQFGTLANGTTASTAYLMEVAGPVVIYNGGTWAIGTSGTPIPSTSSATLTLNSTVEGDTGVNVRNGATFDSTGVSGGRGFIKTKLTATATSGVTSALTTADTTGWLSGDSIYIAGTTTGPANAAGYKGEAGTLSGNASGTTVTLTGAVTNTHTATALSYTSSSTGKAYALNMYPDVILLNRNVIIQGSGATTNAYLFGQPNSNIAIAWTEFSQMSGTVAGQRGLEADTGPLGTLSVTNSSFINSHNSAVVLAPANASFGGTQGSVVTFQHNVLYNVASAGSGTIYGLVVLTTTRNPYWLIDDVAVIFVGNGTFSANPVLMNSVIGQVTNITISGSANSGTYAFNINGPYSSAGTIGGNIGNTWGPFTFYSNIGFVFAIQGSNGITGTINGLNVWHEGGRVQTSMNSGDITFDPFYVVQDGFGLYLPNGGGQRVTVRNGIIGFDSSGQTVGVQIDATSSVVYMDNMEICPFGALGGVTFVQCSTNNQVISLQSDIGPGGTVPSQAQIYLRNSSILNNSGTAWPSQKGQEAYYGKSAFVVQDCAACTPVKHGAWLLGGYVNYDTAITHTSGFSERMTPRVNTFSASISGTAMTIVGGAPTFQLGDSLTSNGAGFIPGTELNSCCGSPAVTIPQTVSTSTFQSYNPQNNALIRLQSAPLGQGVQVAVASGKTAQVCVYIRTSLNTDAAPTWGGSAVTYNADNPRMIVRQNPYMGVQSDTVLATFSGSSGVWTQLCGTTPSAPADGQFEIVIDADQTFTSNAGGWVNVAEWSCSAGCGSPNNGQFWWNGSPASFVTPPGGAANVIGGYLLRRDINHNNDNWPVWLKKAS